MDNAEQLKEAGLEAARRRDWSTAVTHFINASQAYANEGNKAQQAEMLNNLGVVHRQAKQLQEAEVALDEAIALFGELGQKNEQGQAYGNLGDLHAAQGKPQQATASYLQSDQLLKEADAKGARAQVMRTLSLHYLRQRQWLESIRWMEGSLSVKPRVGLAEWLFRLLLRFALGLLGLSAVER